MFDEAQTQTQTMRKNETKLLNELTPDSYHMIQWAHNSWNKHVWLPHYSELLAQVRSAVADDEGWHIPV